MFRHRGRWGLVPLTVTGNWAPHSPLGFSLCLMMPRGWGTAALGSRGHRLALGYANRCWQLGGPLSAWIPAALLRGRWAPPPQRHLPCHYPSPTPGVSMGRKWGDGPSFLHHRQLPA